jgi:hypothetical protein
MKFGLIFLSLLSAAPSLVYSRDTLLTLCRKESPGDKPDCQEFVNYDLDKCMDLWVRDFFKFLSSFTIEAGCCAFYRFADSSPIQANT